MSKRIYCTPMNIKKRLLCKISFLTRTVVLYLKDLDGPGFSRSLAEREELQPVVTGSTSAPWGPGLYTPGNIVWLCSSILSTCSCRKRCGGNTFYWIVTSAMHNRQTTSTFLYSCCVALANFSGHLD